MDGEIEGISTADAILIITSDLNQAGLTKNMDRVEVDLALLSKMMEFFSHRKLIHLLTLIPFYPMPLVEPSEIPVCIIQMINFFFVEYLNNLPKSLQNAKYHIHITDDQLLCNIEDCFKIAQFIYSETLNGVELARNYRGLRQTFERLALPKFYEFLKALPKDGEKKNIKCFFSDARSSIEFSVEKREKVL